MPLDFDELFLALAAAAQLTCAAAAASRCLQDAHQAALLLYAFHDAVVSDGFFWGHISFKHRTNLR